MAARAYLATVAALGAVWWLAVFGSEDIRRLTLGGWSPQWLFGPDLCLFVGASALGAIRASWRWAALAAIWTTSVSLALVGYSIATRQAGWGAVAMIPCAVVVIAAAITLRAGVFPTGWFFTGPFRFREAHERTPKHHLKSSLAQLVVFWTAFFVAIPAVLTAGETRVRIDAPSLRQPPFRAAGVLLLAVGSAVGLWSCASMALQGHGTPLPVATARRLVMVGPYRHLRNPMAVAGALQTIGVGLLLGSWTVVAVALIGALAWDVFIRPDEEQDLARRFGPAFDHYRRSVRCWLPRLRMRPHSQPPRSGAVSDPGPSITSR